MPVSKALFKLNGYDKSNISFDAFNGELKCVTWNIEGFSRSKFKLLNMLNCFQPDLVFLSEPKLYQCDLMTEMNLFTHQYQAALCSDDLFDPELPITKCQALDGTMILWKHEHHQYVKVLPRTSSAFLAVLFSPPGLQISIHIAIYLPTSGREDAFIDAITSLKESLLESLTKYPNSCLFIRGDANVNEKHYSRSVTFRSFCKQLNLQKVVIGHMTYHHFMGNGLSDSELDVLLYSGPGKEVLNEVLCKLNSPDHTSHHDALLSTSVLPAAKENPLYIEHEVAPRISNDRIKVKWTEDGVISYKSLLSNDLEKLRESWLDPSSAISTSILLASTNSLLKYCAQATNPTVDLAKPLSSCPKKKPQYIVNSERSLFRSHVLLRKTAPSSESYKKAKHIHQERRRLHNKLVRYSRMQEDFKRNCQIASLISSEPSAAFKFLRAKKSNQIGKISKLHVDNRTYMGSDVPDGMFQSIKSLKTEKYSLDSCSNLPDFANEYRLILDICSAGNKIPKINKTESTRILLSLKKEVNDLYIKTALHFINAGEAGLDHFHFIFNTIIENVNLAGVEELNSIYACFLFKGHGKDRE